MIFAELLCGAGGVEVTQTNKLYAIDLVVPAQKFFESQFRFAVGADRARRSGFVDWQAIRRAEDGAGRRKHHPPDAGCDHGVEQVQSVGNVVPKIFGRIVH